MIIQIDNVVSFSVGGILGFIISRLFEHYLARRRSFEDRKAKRFDDAAIEYRRAILCELQVIYPARHQNWRMSEYHRFVESIIGVERAVVAFRSSVADKRSLANAFDDFRNFCLNVSFDSVAAWYMYETMREPGDISPVDKFNLLVEKLLSFSDNNS